MTHRFTLLRFVLPCLLLAAFLGVIGCSGSSDPATVRVSGTVRFKGQPVDKASVVFVPKDGKQATGSTDAKGRFTLTTFANGDGAIVGGHQVAIVKVEADPATAKDDYPSSINLLPELYANPANSPLNAKVEKSGKNDFAFDLVEVENPISTPAGDASP